MDAEYRKKYTAANIDKIRAQRKKYYEENKERMRNRSKAYYHANRDAKLADSNAYYQKHRESIKRKYDARSQASVPPRNPLTFNID